jgi:hypothetical protein
MRRLLRYIERGGERVLGSKPQQQRKGQRERMKTAISRVCLADIIQDVVLGEQKNAVNKWGFCG